MEGICRGSWWCVRKCRPYPGLLECLDGVGFLIKGYGVKYLELFEEVRRLAVERLEGPIVSLGPGMEGAFTECI